MAHKYTQNTYNIVLMMASDPNQQGYIVILREI